MNVITRQVYFFEDLELGMEASFAKTVSEADINSFAGVTGDNNPCTSTPSMPPGPCSSSPSPTAC